MNRKLHNAATLALLLMLGLVVGILEAKAVPLPGDAVRLLPTLASEQARFWPDLPIAEFPAALIEQESGWKVRATLKTDRELGAGLGQFTKAFNRDGSIRFDALAEAAKLDVSLAGWTWRDAYNEQYQLRAVVLKLRANSHACQALMATAVDTLACAAAQYNGGAGSVATRIRLCRSHPGCDPRRWAGHLENQVAQSTRKVKGYGESFATINSRYPGRVFARMPKYKGHVS